MAVTISAYNKLAEYFGDNTIDLDDATANAFRAELYNSTHVFTATHTARVDVSANALATGFGYTNPGQGLTAVTWVEASGVITWDAADVSWAAAGGAIGPARHCLLYYDISTVPVDALMLDIDFGVDETAGDGTNFVVTLNAGGIFTIA